MGPMSNTISMRTGVINTTTYPTYTTTTYPVYSTTINSGSINSGSMNIGSEIKEFVREVHKEIEENKLKEATGMDIVEWKKLQDNIKMCHGSLEYHMDLVYGSEVTITLPAEYLKFLKVQMPTTDYGSIFDRKVPTPNFVEGIPLIKKIDTYNDRVTKVTFADDTFTKAVCSDNDHFDLDVGITICCMKRLMGEDGNRHYNDLIRHAHKVIADNDIAKEKKAKEKAEAKHKQRKAEMHRIAKRLKAKEEQIDIQKQAIIRAHQELEGLTSEKA